MADIFRRVEKKYILSIEKYEALRKALEDYMKPDEYGESKICNIYFDTDRYDMISHSISKPVYKDKVRLRSYNTPNMDSTVFLEIKKKYEGVVGKRRISMKLSDFYEYLNNKDSIDSENKQIKTEIDYYFKFYNLKPSMYVSYDRRAFYGKDDMNFRITFDNNITARQESLRLEDGSYGTKIFEPDKYVMEVKTLGSMPLWFVKILNDLEIAPCGYSKYGEGYTQLVLKANDYKSCVV